MCLEERSWVFEIKQSGDVFIYSSSGGRLTVFSPKHRYTLPWIHASTCTQTGSIYEKATLVWGPEKRFVLCCSRDVRVLSDSWQWNWCAAHQCPRDFPRPLQTPTGRGIPWSTPRQVKTPMYVDPSYKAFYLAYLISNFYIVLIVYQICNSIV